MEGLTTAPTRNYPLLPLLRDNQPSQLQCVAFCFSLQVQVACLVVDCCFFIWWQEHEYPESPKIGLADCSLLNSAETNPAAAGHCFTTFGVTQRTHQEWCFRQGGKGDLGCKMRSCAAWWPFYFSANQFQLRKVFCKCSLTEPCNILGSTQRMTTSRKL